MPDDRSCVCRGFKQKIVYKKNSTGYNIFRWTRTDMAEWQMLCT
jgi:hypothetical protein